MFRSRHVSSSRRHFIMNKYVSPLQPVAEMLMHTWDNWKQVNDGPGAATWHVTRDTPCHGSRTARDDTFLPVRGERRWCGDEFVTILSRVPAAVSRVMWRPGPEARLVLELMYPGTYRTRWVGTPVGWRQPQLLLTWLRPWRRAGVDRVNVSHHCRDPPSISPNWITAAGRWWGGLQQTAQHSEGCNYTNFQGSLVNKTSSSIMWRQPTPDNLFSFHVDQQCGDICQQPLGRNVTPFTRSL